MKLTPQQLEVIQREVKNGFITVAVAKKLLDHITIVESELIFTDNSLNNAKKIIQSINERREIRRV